MVLLPLIGLIGGFAAIYLLDVTVPAAYASYLSLATLAGLDAIIGGIRSGIEEKFQTDIFISGFLANTLLAVLLAYIGEQVGVDLFLAAVVVIGGRIFLNVSLIRRYWLTKIALAKKEQ
ncbi:MAG TPA: small basic family protein [Armatimonadota bacterium]|nr:small basic family protein [Armatimonadota bacterium]